MTNQEIVNIFNEIIKKSNFFATSEEVNQWLAINELYVLYGNYEEIKQLALFEICKHIESVLNSLKDILSVSSITEFDNELINVKKSQKKFQLSSVKKSNDSVYSVQCKEKLINEIVAISESEYYKACITIKSILNDIVLHRKSLMETDFVLKNENKKLTVKEKIELFIKKRRIKYLVHFTAEYNLKSILKYGIIPTTILDSKNLLYKENYHKKSSFERKTVCLSISKPDKYRLNKFQDKYSKRRYCLIFINPKILLDKFDLASFYSVNHNNYENKGLTQLERLHEMFVDLVTNHSIAVSRNNRLALNKTTDESAEILFNGIISPMYIENVYYADESLVDYRVLPDPNDIEMSSEYEIAEAFPELNYVCSTYINLSQPKTHDHGAITNHFFNWDEEGDADLDSGYLEDVDVDEAYEYF